jgi:hypothetical protein
MCLVLLLSSCASVDQWAKAVFTPPPYESIYPTDEDGFPMPIMVQDTGAYCDREFEEYQEPHPCLVRNRVERSSLRDNREFQQRRKALKNNTLYNK